MTTTPVVDNKYSSHNVRDYGGITIMYYHKT
jgi:hypothetical protein